MDDRSRHDRPRLLALSLLVLPLALAGCGGGGSPAAGGSGAGPTPTAAVAGAISRVRSAYGGMPSSIRAATLPAWMKVDADGTSVALTITTAGFTFNGASKGTMTITVPQGWKVAVTYRNTTSVAHSLVIAAQASTPLPTTGFAPAMTGASTTNPATGQAKSTQQFSFTASSAGLYIMVCDVPGHADAGMWDHFDVSATAKVPTVKMG